VAAGFKEKLRIMYLLEDELKPAIDMPSKSCHSVAYSNGGQYLAAANGQVILIIDPYTFELKFSLSGHPSLVRFLAWNTSDSLLMSVCHNGTVYGWNTHFEFYQPVKGKSEEEQPIATKLEVILKGIKIHAVGYDEEYDLFFLSAADNNLYVKQTEGLKGVKDYVAIHTSDCELTALLLGKQQNVLFAGTSKGSIRVYLWPIFRKKQKDLILLEGSEVAAEQQIEFMEYFAHLGKVVSLEYSADRQSVISCGADGSIFVQSIKEMCNGVDMNLAIGGQEPKKKKNQLLNKCKVHVNMN